MLITNFRKEKRNQYEKAIKIYKNKVKDCDLYIDKNAYVSGGRKDEALNALRSNQDEELTEFWKIFRSLK